MRKTEFNGMPHSPSRFKQMFLQIRGDLMVTFELK
jgi:hypothetical protein